MPLEPKRLRRWFAAAAIFVIGISVAYYLYARIHVWRAIESAPAKMGIDIQQSTQGFTLSKSEAGRTIFTIHASKAVQYKEGGRAQLRDVSILVYGRRSDRFDQIHGDDFQYDPNSGDIIANGEVTIDLEGDAQGPVRPDQAAPLELKNPVHLKTSGLKFNQKTGAAETHEKIEFFVPQASGSAMGANYDSKSNTLILESQVQIETREGATVLARHAIIAQNPRRAVLHAARIERPTSDIDAGQLTLFLRDDNSISRMIATDGVRAASKGPNRAIVDAPQGEFTLGVKSELLSGLLSGGVKVDQEGVSPFRGGAERAMLTFGPRNVLTTVKATENVHIVQDRPATKEQAAQSLALDSDALDLFMSKGHLERGVTGGAAKITVHPQAPKPSQGNTVISAGRFEMKFGADSRLRTLHGEPDARISSSTPGQPEKVSTSTTLDVVFGPSGGGIESVDQKMNVRYTDGQRTATANVAHYTPADELLVLTGSPRWTEGSGTTTARVLKVNRKSGEAFAEGDVKTTYRETKTEPGGALLGGSEPVNVTAENMTAQRQTGSAIYSGSARLWQGANVVTAPVIEFQRGDRVLRAQGGSHPVSTVFIENSGKSTESPVTVTSSSLTYSDPQHKATFQGAVVLKSREGTVNADSAEVLLEPRSQAARSSSGATQIEEIVAQGHVVLQQASRKAVGNTMTYTAADEKYVLSGGRPSIFDAERGTTTGDSLTFFGRSDTVLVGSDSPARTLTQTHTGK